MKTLIGLLLFILFALATEACMYNDSESYYVNPIPGDSATLVVITNLDTIGNPVITDSLMIKYSAEIEGGELYVVDCNLDNLLLYEYISDYDPDTLAAPYVLSDSFWIRGSLPLEPGIKTMSLSFYYSANTNSLADKYGIEASKRDLEYDIKLEGEIK